MNLGLEVKRQEDAFARMTASLGINGAALEAALEKASQGIVDTSDVMITTVKALQEGLAPQTLVKFMEIATQQSKLMGVTVAEAFNQITTAVLAQQERGLKSAGIYLDLTDVFDKYAASIGTTADKLTDMAKTQALAEAVITKTAGSVAALGDGMLTQAQQVEKLGTAWQNVKESIGKFLVESGAGVVEWAQKIASWVGAAGAAIDKFARAISPTVAEAAAASQDKHNESLREAARASNAAASGVGNFGINTAAAGALVKTTGADLKKMADEADKAAEKVAKIDKALEGMAGEFDADVLEAGWKRIDAALEAAAKQAEAVDKALESIGDDFDADVLEAGWKRVEASLEAAAKQAEAVDKALESAGDDFDADVLEAGIRRMDEALDDAVKSAEDAAKANQAYAESLAVIGAKAALLGDDFDASTASIAAMQSELDRLLELSKGQITPEIEALGAALRSSLADQSLIADIKAGFQSITDAISTSIKGVIQGTQTAGDALKNALQNMGLGILDFFIHKVFDPLLDMAAEFAFQVWKVLTSGGSLSSAFSSIIGGVGAVGSAFGNAAVPAGELGKEIGVLNTTAAGSSSSWVDLLGMGNQAVGVFSNLGTIWSALTTGWNVFTSALSTGSTVLQAANLGATALGKGLGALGGTLGTVVAGLGAAFTLYSGITALTEGRTGEGIGTLGGAAAGAIAGGIIGSVVPGIGTLIGALIGAGIGGAAGGGIGSLFDEDWEMIHKLRAQQRNRTALTALGETTGRLFESSSLSGLAESFRQPIIGTGSSTGDVIRRMAWLTTPEGGGINFEGGQQFTLPPEVANRIVSFLGEQGFTGAEFDSGRVNSITELIAATGGGDIGAGIGDWQTLLEGLDAFILAMQAAQAGLDDIEGIDFAALADKPVELAAAIRRGATDIISALKIADELGKAGFEGASTNIKNQIAEIVASFGDFDAVLEQVKEAFIEAALQDPTVLLTLLDMSQFQRAGEEIGETTERVGESLAGLGELMAQLRQATQEVDLERISDDLSAAVGAMDDAIAKTKEALAAATDPTDILASAQLLTELTMARYQMEIDAVNALLGVLRTSVEGILATAENIASQAPFLAQIGVDIAEATSQMIAFARSLAVDVPTMIATLGGAANLLVAQFRQALLGGDLGSAAQSGRDLLAGLEEAFRAALELTDPGAQVEALNALLSLLGDGVGQITQALAASGLPEEQQQAILQQILGAVGPLGQEIYDALIEASRVQAEAAAAAAEELAEIIGDDALNAQNFLAQKVDEMAAALESILGQIEAAIRGLSESGFGDIAGILADIRDRIPSAQTGMPYTRAGLYMLHEGEAVLRPDEAAAYRAHGMTPVAATAAPTSGGRSAPVSITFQFGDIHGASRESARDFLDELQRDIRYGKTGEVIAERVKGGR